MKVRLIIEQKSPGFLAPAPFNVEGSSLYGQLAKVKSKLLNFSFAYANVEGREVMAKDLFWGSGWRPSSFSADEGIFVGKTYQDLLPARIIGDMGMDRLDRAVKCLVKGEGKGRECQKSISDPTIREKLFKENADGVLKVLREKISDKATISKTSRRFGEQKYSWFGGFMQQDKTYPWLNQQGQPIPRDQIPTAEEIYYFHLLTQYNKDQTDIGKLQNFKNIPDVTDAPTKRVPLPLSVPNPLPLQEYLHQLGGRFNSELSANKDSVGSCGRVIDLFKKTDGSALEKATWAASGALVGAGTRPVWRFVGRAVQHTGPGQQSTFRRLAGWGSGAQKVPMDANLRQLAWDLFWPGTSAQARGVGGVGGTGIQFHDRGWIGRSPSAAAAWFKGGFARLLLWGLSNNIEAAMMADVAAEEEFRNNPQNQGKDPASRGLISDAAGSLYGSLGIAAWSGVCFTTAMWLMRSWGHRTIQVGAYGVRFAKGTTSRQLNGPMYTIGGRVYVNWLHALEALHGTEYVRALMQYLKGNNLNPSSLTVELAGLMDEAPKLTDELSQLAKTMDEPAARAASPDGTYVITEELIQIARQEARAIAGSSPKSMSAEALVADYRRLLLLLNKIKAAHKPVGQLLERIFKVDAVRVHARNGPIGIIKEHQAMLAALEELMESCQAIINTARAGDDVGVLFPESVVPKLKTVLGGADDPIRVQYIPEQGSIRGIDELLADMRLIDDTANKLAGLGVTNRQILDNIIPVIEAAKNLKIPAGILKTAKGADGELLRLQTQANILLQRAREFRRFLASAGTKSQKELIWKEFLKQAPTEIRIPIGASGSDELVITASTTLDEIINAANSTGILNSLGRYTTPTAGGTRSRLGNILMPGGPQYRIVKGVGGEVKVLRVSDGQVGGAGGLRNPQLAPVRPDPRYPVSLINSTDENLANIARELIKRTENLIDASETLKFVDNLKKLSTDGRFPNLDSNVTGVSPKLGGKVQEGKISKINLKILYN